MEIFERLEKDHREIEELFDQILGASDQAMKTRERMYDRLRAELLGHAKAEEKVFYPRLKQDEDLKDLALEAIEEHHEIELLLDELDELEVDDENWTAKVKVLQENVEHHVEEEEDELFERAKDLLSEDEATEMCERFDEVKSGILDQERREAA